MKVEKFSDVSVVLDDNGLISICCDPERRGTDIYNEYYFLDRNTNETVAHFSSTGVMHAELLSEFNNRIFEVSYYAHNDDDKDIKQIVRTNPDFTYEVLHDIEDYEAGIEDGAFAIRKNGLWGFIDYNGVEIIKPQYDDYRAFRNGYACVKKDKKWGFINKNNELVIPFVYDLPDFYHDERHIERGYSSFVNHNGRLLAKIAKGKKWGITDVNNDIVLPFKYDWLLLGSGKYISAKLNNKFGFIDINDNVVIPFEYDDLGIRKKYIWAQKGEKCGYIDFNNNIVVPFEYEPVEETFCGAYCNLEQYDLIGKKGLIGLFDNENLKEVIPCIYKELEVCDDLIIVKKQNDKYVLINFENQEICSEYEEIEYQNEGIFTVKNNRTSAFMNKQCEILTEMKYIKRPHFFRGGLCVAEYRDFEKGVDVINTKGKVLYHAKRYRGVFNLGNGYVLAENGNREYEFVKLL